MRAALPDPGEAAAAQEFAEADRAAMGWNQLASRKSRLALGKPGP